MKIIGFKMMLGEWANNLDPNDLLEMYVTKIGVGSIRDSKSLSSDCDDELPKNKMSNYNPDTTVMTFMFDEGHDETQLPEYFLKDGGENCKLIYEHDKN